MAKSKSGEFYSFDEVLRQLHIDENRLKRLVSEGEIRAFREGDQMRFKRAEIDALAGDEGGGGTSDTSLTEISLEDDSQPTVNVSGSSDTLSDELLAEPDQGSAETGGMRTAEISSQDTFIDTGDDVGMSTEPIDFTEDEGDEVPESIDDMGVERPSSRRAAPPPAARRRVAVEEERTNPLFIILLLLGALASVGAAAVAISISRGHMNSVTQWFAESFGGYEAGQR